MENFFKALKTKTGQTALSGLILAALGYWQGQITLDAFIGVAVGAICILFLRQSNVKIEKKLDKISAPQEKK